jgi:hypothetical protein
MQFESIQSNATVVRHLKEARPNREIALSKMGEQLVSVSGNIPSPR